MISTSKYEGRGPNHHVIQMLSMRKSRIPQLNNFQKLHPIAPDKHWKNLKTIIYPHIYGKLKNKPPHMGVCVRWHF